MPPAVVLLLGFTAGPGVANCVCALIASFRSEFELPPAVVVPGELGPPGACDLAAPAQSTISPSAITFQDARLIFFAIIFMLNRLRPHLPGYRGSYSKSVCLIEMRYAAGCMQKSGKYVRNWHKTQDKTLSSPVQI